MQFYHSQRLKPKQYSKYLITESQASNRALISVWNILPCEKAMPKEHFFTPFFLSFTFLGDILLMWTKDSIKILQLKHNTFASCNFQILSVFTVSLLLELWHGGNSDKRIKCYQESEANFRFLEVVACSDCIQKA